MTIVNTETMAFFGPGSEWLWALLQVLVIGVTLFFVYGQLRAIRMANALSELRKLAERWESRNMIQAGLLAATQLRDSPQAAMSRPASLIAEFFSDMHSLRDRGVLDEREVMEAWAARCDSWWVLLGPLVGPYRTAERSEKLYLGFEDLAKFTRRRAASWGITPARTDEASRAVLIETAIQRAKAALDSLDKPSG